MNVMVMAVYERIREIGTIAAIGTLPGKIVAMFLIEGFSLGFFGAVVGDILGRQTKRAFTFSKRKFTGYSYDLNNSNSNFSNSKSSAGL